MDLTGPYSCLEECCLPMWPVAVLSGYPLEAKKKFGFDALVGLVARVSAAEKAA